MPNTTNIFKCVLFLIGLFVQAFGALEKSITNQQMGYKNV